MFKGTSKVPNDEFSRLSRIYGGTVNAATFTNYTNYYQLYPKTYFPMALELEADRMRNLLLRKQDFDPEIKVVMEERRPDPMTTHVHSLSNVSNGFRIPQVTIVNPSLAT